MGKLLMVNDYFWENSDILVEHLADHLKNNRLSLVLGAGASNAFGLPNWNKLIQNMETLMSSDKYGFGADSDLGTADGSVDKAEAIRAMFDRKSGYQKYIDLVHDALYYGISSDFKVLSERKILDAIAVLCIPSRRGAIKDIITFNFDNILEIYLSYYGIISYSPVNGNLWRSNSDVNVYHIHGFLPEDDKNGRSKRIVFDRASYDEKKEFQNWEWAPQISSLLRSTTAIFIGLSGEDPNMELFLKDTNKYHANKISECHQYWGVSFVRKKAGLEPILRKWKSWGIYPWVISGNGPNGSCSYEEFENEIKSFLLLIAQKAARSF